MYREVGLLESFWCPDRRADLMRSRICTCRSTALDVFCLNTRAYRGVQGWRLYRAKCFFYVVALKDWPKVIDTVNEIEVKELRGGGYNRVYND